MSAGDLHLMLSHVEEQDRAKELASSEDDVAILKSVEKAIGMENGERSPFQGLRFPAIWVSLLFVHFAEYDWVCDLTPTESHLEKSVRLYTLSLNLRKEATSANSEPLKTIAKRLGNAHNETGVYHMHQLSQIIASKGVFTQSC